jgi:hypothetical protein
MTCDDIPFDYEDDRLLSDEEQQYRDDCNERADDMRQEVRSIWG